MSRDFDKIYLQLLVLRCQAGDREALALLIARYAPGLRTFLAKLTASATVEDLEQDVWLHVSQNIHRLKEPAAFVGWLYRIARDCAYRELRRKRLPLSSIDDITWQPPEGLSQEEAQAVRTALMDISEDQRHVLQLRFIDDKTYEEIAAATGLPLGTVRSRIHYARAALKARLLKMSFWRRDFV